MAGSPTEEVIREVSLGEPAMSRRRVEALSEIPALRVDDAVRLLANVLIGGAGGQIPRLAHAIATDD